MKDRLDLEREEKKRKEEEERRIAKEIREKYNRFQTIKVSFGSSFKNRQQEEIKEERRRQACKRTERN